MKPFYIESDEEVTSVIDRLRASQQKQNIFVIPTGATLLQSAVNMRLLLREAQKADKELVVVTADEYGQTLAQKVGINTYASLDEVDGVEHDAAPQEMATHNDAESVGIGSTSYYETPHAAQPAGHDVNMDISHEDAQAQESRSVASDQAAQSDATAAQAASIQRAAEDFEQMQHNEQSVPLRTASAMDMQATPKESMPARSGFARQVDPQQLQPTPDQQMAQQQQPMHAPARQEQPQQQPMHAPARQEQPQQLQSMTPQSQRMAPQQQAQPMQRPAVAHLDEHKEKEVQAFFGRAHGADMRSSQQPMRWNVQQVPQQHNAPKKEKEKKGLFGRKEKNMSSYAHVPKDMTYKKKSSHKIAMFFGLGGLLVASFILAIVFLPRVTVVLVPTVREESATVNVTADATQGVTDFSAKKMNLIVLDEEIDQVSSFEATGAADQETYKARGSITIYNNYSAQSQRLVVKTRFLSEDGTLFRLTEPVTVPGMTTNAAGESVPGSIVASVEADQPGAEYNIAPTTFTIPGFEGSPRYTKFSAESAQAMIGGGAEGGAQKAVTAEDVESAKKATEEAAMKAAREKLVADAQTQGKKVVEDGIKLEIVASESQAVAGVPVESFDYTVRVKAQALAFGEQDVRIMLDNILQERVSGEDVTLEDVVLAYSPSLANFDDRTLELKVKGTARIVPNIDTSAIQSALTGVKKDNINTVLGEFEGVEEAQLRYDMGFIIGRMPWYKGSITVTVDDTME